MKEYKCFTCRDGEIDLEGNCPECGRSYHTGGEPLKDVIVTEEYNRLYIPKEYRGVVWDKEKLRQTHESLTGIDKHFEVFANSLEKIHNIFLEGRIPKNSMLIIAPRTFSKLTLAYSCLQLAYKHSYKIFPIMDTQQLKRFLTLSVERPTAPILKTYPFQYEDIMTADIMFLTISKGYDRNGSYEIVDQIIDMRSRMDKPTIIISRFSIKDMSGFDYFGRFASIINEHGQNKRYPTFIQYTDNTMRLKK